MSRYFVPEKLYKKIVEILPLSCVDIIVKKKNHFLLIKRLENPAKNKWWFPGGRILFNETLKSAVKRKLKEELNIKKLKNIKFLGVKETKFKKGKFKKPVYCINNLFLAELNENDCLKISADKTITEYKWFKSISRGFHPYIKKNLKLAGFK